MTSGDVTEHTSYLHHLLALFPCTNEARGRLAQCWVESVCAQHLMWDFGRGSSTSLTHRYVLISLHSGCLVALFSCWEDFLQLFRLGIFRELAAAHLDKPNASFFCTLLHPAFFMLLELFRCR